MTTVKQLVGQIQRPGSKPEDVNLFVSQRPVLTEAERSAGIRWVDGRYKPGDVRRYGAVQGTNVDSAAAIQSAYDISKKAGAHPCVIEGTYRIDSTLDFDATGGTPLVICRNATITKNFNGTGIDLLGGANFNEFHGSLVITKMLNAADGAGGGTPTAGDYGINQNCRFRQFGKIKIDSQQDDGYHISATANTNGTYHEFITSEGNNGKGFGGSGTSDNVAVWTGRWGAKNNYEAGVEFPDTFPARAWRFDFRTEGNARDGTSDQFYSGGMNNSRIWIYPEEVTSSTGVELHIPAASDKIEVFCSRINTYTISSTSAVVLEGGRYRSNNANPVIPGHVFEGLNDNGSKVATRTDDGSSGATLWEEKWYGNGDHELIADDRDSGSTVSWYFNPQTAGIQARVDGSIVAVITRAGGIGTKTTVTNTNTPSGATSDALPIYDETGTLIGYIPIYASQW